MTATMHRTEQGARFAALAALAAFAAALPEEGAEEERDQLDGLLALLVVEDGRRFRRGFAEAYAAEVYERGVFKPADVGLQTRAGDALDALEAVLAVEADLWTDRDGQQAAGRTMLSYL